MEHELTGSNGLSKCQEKTSNYASHGVGQIHAMQAWGLIDSDRGSCLNFMVAPTETWILKKEAFNECAILTMALREVEVRLLSPADCGAEGDRG